MCVHEYLGVCKSAHNVHLSSMEKDCLYVHTHAHAVYYYYVQAILSHGGLLNKVSVRAGGDRALILKRSRELVCFPV